MAKSLLVSVLLLLLCLPPLAAPATPSYKAATSAAAQDAAGTARRLPAGVSVGGFGAPAGLEMPVADPRRHLWGIVRSPTAPLALAEWDGSRWRLHRSPPDVSGTGDLYACDTLGRLWLRSSHWSSAAQHVEGRTVYDPAHNTWTNYAAVPEALQTAAALPGMTFLPHRGTEEPPVFSGDGRVAYVYHWNDTTVFLYDGKAWHHWVPHDILGDNAGHSVRDLFFSHTGSLALTLDHEVWEWKPEAGWRRAGPEPKEEFEDFIPPGSPPGLSQATLNGNPVVDSLGATWLAWHDAVDTASDGLWVKQPELSAPGSPFRHGYPIWEVLRDPAGRLFFVFRPAGRWDLVAWFPPPVPKPRVSVTPLSEDAVRVHFASALPEPHWFQWRVNGGKWSAATAAKAQDFMALPRGNYKIEAQALDARLQVSPSAAAV